MPSPGPNKKASAKALPFLQSRLARQGSNLDSPGPEPGVLPITPRANAAVLQRAPIIGDSPYRIKALGHSSVGIVPLEQSLGGHAALQARTSGEGGAAHSRNTLKPRAAERPRLPACALPTEGPRSRQRPSGPADLPSPRCLDFRESWADRPPHRPRGSLSLSRQGGVPDRFRNRQPQGKAAKGLGLR